MSTVMDDKKPARLVGSKVSQIANIFQSMVPAKETEVLITNAVPLRNNQREGSPKPERRRTLAGEDVIKESSPTQVTVVRTESHVARFNNARALFEKLAEDKKPEKVCANNVQLPPLKSSSNSSAGNSPVRSPKRSPSPSRLYGSAGSIDSVPDVDLVKPKSNGHQNGDFGMGNGSGDSPVPMTVTERLAQSRLNGAVPSNKVNGIGKLGRVDNSFKSTQPDPKAPAKKPEKPEKPERKFNSRELIEKQRNWTSHFSKSRSTRYNSDPNKSEVRVSLSATGNTNNSQVDTKIDTSLPPVTPAARSASFTAASRAVRSPPCSPPPPPVRNCPPRPYLDPPQKGEAPKSPTKPDNRSVSPVSPIMRSDETQLSKSPVSPFPEDLQEKDSQDSSSTNSDSILLSPGRNSDVLPDAEKRLREEDAEEVRKDVAHIDKRTKMVSSVHVTLQAAGLGPTKPSSTSSSYEDLGSSPTPQSDLPLYTEETVNAEPIITNSVLRELESQNSAFSDLIPEARYTEVTSQNCRDVEKVQQVLGNEPYGHEPSSNLKNDANFKRSLPFDIPAPRVTNEIFDDELGEEDFSSRTFLPKTSADFIGGSGYVASRPDYDSLEYFHLNKLASDKSAEVVIVDTISVSQIVRSSVEPPKVPSPEEQELEELKELAAESVLDLQDVEYADADAEDGSEESEHEDEKLKRADDIIAKTLAEPTILDRPRQKTEGPDAMTPDEAENLLSSRILEKKIRQEGLLSDEEAQEVTRLLSPTDDGDRDDPEWLADVLSVSSSSLLNESTLHDSTLDGRSRSEISATMEDSMTSSRIGSQSGSDLLGSVSSLTDQEGVEEPRVEDYCPLPGRIVVVENGVHYYEDGHFWMEVPGIPDSEEDEDADLPIPVKANTKVTFSTGPIKVYSTFSVNDYDRRNEDVDPVAASAEYELEKRVEKMDVFPVELIKGAEGLGLSIIGMGVGADAGLEKLGIFVKTITENGAASKDGRIQVNDQIIEVDGKSLVGVTQAYAASVLRNTCGLVKFLIGRERDAANSEVAQLIKQSLQADREREEQRRQMEQPAPPRTTSRGYHHLDPGGISSPDGQRSEDSSTTLPLTGTSPTTSSSSDAPISPPGTSDHAFEMEPTNTANDLESLRQLLQESHLKLAHADKDISRLKSRLTDLEGSAPDNEEYIERLRQSSMKLRETERNFYAAKKDVANYQDMLEQSQGQYIMLEKKYCKAKKLLREFQQREQDMLHREEFYLQLLQEKDTEYNALVKSLKDRVIQLEQELLETQRKAGLPAVLPYDSSNLRQLTPQLTRRQQAPPVKPLLQSLETELSDTEISDISPEDGDKTATVERKMPVKEELDRAVPPHELLDVSASKAKAELATRGGLAGRQLPTNKKAGGLSSSSSDYGLDGSMENSADEEEQDRRHLFIEYTGQEDVPTNVAKSPVQQSPVRPTTLSPTSPSYVSPSIAANTHVHSLVAQFATAQQLASQPIMIPKSQPHPHHFQSLPPALHSPSGQALYAHATHAPATQPLHLHPHHPHPTQPQPQGTTDPWSMKGKVPQPTFPVGAQRGLQGPPPSLAEQLKQVLAERERRISGGDSSREGSGDFTEINKVVTQSLVEEIRQAVNEANARVKKVPLSQSLAPPGTQPWLPQGSPMRDMGPPSPSSMSSGSISPGASLDPSPSRLGDSQEIWTPAEKKTSHVWQTAPVTDWSKEQVCQWLLALGLEQHIPRFLELQIGGSSLLQLESRDFKTLGINGDDKNRLKRKLKELKVQVEKEKRQLEKDRKEKERLQRKAEKLAEKASKRK